ncbi:hypothetical protein [Brevundimonas sp. Root1423]|uniref:hypothetical protein n=1 Tax=Brevundimonas sp. Root1423 TaxID=1736462 RepID=UPI0012E3D27A|nr:hypothetical protein [Brevundimonas sp. Root1423]
MLTAALIAAALLAGGQVSVIAATPAPAEARSTSATHAELEAGTRRVCRLERATGSNLQQRVCRTIRVAAPQTQQTREFLRNLQRVRTPDVN